MDPFLVIIDQRLSEDESRPPKQRHTAHRIYDRLVYEFGFRGGESTVRQYVREVRPRREVIIRLDHDSVEAQVDWGEAQVYLDGHATEVHLSCLSLCFSQRFFVMAFPRESREAFCAGLIKELMEAQAQLRLSKLEAALLKLDLLVLDEVGFVPFSKVGAELLFGLLTDRYERGSVLVTSIPDFASWTVSPIVATSSSSKGTLSGSKRV